MAAPSDEMNEEQHLRPLSIFNTDDNFISKKNADEKRERLYFRQQRVILSITT
jgi:hypothetical protein